MKLARRLILTAPALLLARPAAAARLRPDRPGPVVLLPAESGRMALRCEGIDDAVTVPGARARIAMLLPVAGRDIAGIAFAADGIAGRLDLMALAGWDGARLRILGMEVLGWAGADGSSLSSRFAGVGDRTRLRVQRVAAMPRPGAPKVGAPKVWETWTDLLAWRDRAPLADSPVRPGAPGSWQARLAAMRARAAALLDPPCLAVTAELQAAFGALPG
ncbi:hypothetical protein [Limobrevibacterium gyesilva]|uniref:Uncharacterized protein n=1 Tax=Limobrevibacterium gyesilva TaxID=2991712 RepID=A0AA41YP90_9PROT|nr:hypothetical protein [Limobrevibacterium gyesilva]MCW3473995.1 hypothetical protein [Limobrevibacterium gyesilva]